MGRKYRDYTGQKIGNLTVLNEVEPIVYEKTKNVQHVWLCRCDCGNEVKIRSSNLENGHTTSCGCMKRKTNINLRKCNEYKICNDYVIGFVRNTDKQFLIDIDDYNDIKNYNWAIDNHGYVVTKRYGKTIKLHRLIMNIQNSKIQVDHINNDKTDNRKSNLRIATPKDNMHNRKPSIINKSGCVGVTYDEERRKWVARLTFNGNEVLRKRFNSKEEAINARIDAENKYFGEFGYHNSQLIANKNREEID